MTETKPLPTIKDIKMLPDRDVDVYYHFIDELDTVLLAHEKYWKERLESAMSRSVPKEVEHCRSCLITIQGLRGKK